MGSLIPEMPPHVIRQYLSRIAWRRDRKKEFPGAEFDEKYSEDPDTAFIVHGAQYFDHELIRTRMDELMHFKPNKSFERGKIFHKRLPGRRYIIGADVATGRTVKSDDTDFCAAVVLDLETGEEVAALHARITPEDFGYDLDDLGSYYNHAIIAIERTGDGGTTILTLTGECKYSAIYKHREWFKRERKVVEIEGFPTTIKTRPIALNKANKFIRDNPHMVWDREFLAECLTFVRNEKGKPEALVGAHDDRVSARWVAHGARECVLGFWTPYEGPSEKYQSASQMPVEDDGLEEVEVDAAEE